MAKPKPPVEAVVDTAVHPLFARLREEAGFAEFSGATLETMLEAPGLKMVLFAEDPNLRRETLDIAVIGPELRKALGAAVASGWYTAFSEGRALGARYGIRKFPAVALFRGAEYLGAAEGLMGWDEYIQALVEIGAREKGPSRTIAILQKTED